MLRRLQQTVIGYGFLVTIISCHQYIFTVHLFCKLYLYICVCLYLSLYDNILELKINDQVAYRSNEEEEEEEEEEEGGKTNEI